MAVIAGIIIANLNLGCRLADPVEEEWLFFPTPPAAPRVQFLTWASGAGQVEPRRSSFKDWILGDEPVGRRAIIKPYGLAARDGVVYVCDTKGLAMCRLDFKNRTYSTFGTRGPGRLKKPINVVIDPLGFKFVVDPERKQVVVFGPDDKHVTAYDIEEPWHPVDVAVYGNELYVLDNDDTPQVHVLDRSDGRLLRSLGEAGAEAGQFKKPGSLCVDTEGYLYVSDTHNWRIQKLTREGEPVWAKGTAGYSLGRFGRPRGIRVGPGGILYIVDAGTQLVQMWNTDGDVLMRLGGPGNRPGALALPSQVAIDRTSLSCFQQYVHKDFTVEYLIFVASQYGPRLINVYAFGSFPQGYRFSESQVIQLPKIEMDEGIGPATQPVPAPEWNPHDAQDRPAEPEDNDPED